MHHHVLTRMRQPAAHVTAEDKVTPRQPSSGLATAHAPRPAGVPLATARASEGALCGGHIFGRTKTGILDVSTCLLVHLRTPMGYVSWGVLSMSQHRFIPNQLAHQCYLRGCSRSCFNHYIMDGVKVQLHVRIEVQAVL